MLTPEIVYGDTAETVTLHRRAKICSKLNVFAVLYVGEPMNAQMISLSAQPSLLESVTEIVGPPAAKVIEYVCGNTA